MKSQRRLVLALLLSSGLAGCAATQPVAQMPAYTALAMTASAAEAPLDLGDDPSVSGLYIAGSTALRDGRADDAARFFERAAEIAPEEDKAFLREETFTAAVMGGDIERAARAAPADADADGYQLGRLVLAIDDLARGEGQAAYDILKTENLGPAYRMAADLVRPWAALAAGDTPAALGQRVAIDSPQQEVPALNQARILEATGQAQAAGTIYAALSDRVPGISVFALAEGANLERQGLRREALAREDALRAQNPNDAEVVQARARAARRGSPPPLPSVQAGAADALLLAAKQALDQRDLRGGVAYLQLSLRLDPGNGEALIMAGGYLTLAGDAAGARAAYDRVPEGAPEYLIAQARVIDGYLAEKDNEAALRRAQALADRAPRMVETQLLLAKVMQASQDYQGSVGVLTKVIDQRGESAEWNLYFARAVNRSMANDWPGAEKDLLQARSLAPEQPDVLNYLGYSWADRGERLDEALVLLKTAAAKTPNDGNVIDSLGWAYFKVGDLEKAVENLERAVELEPAVAEINEHLGDVYAAVDRTLEARYQWERVLTLEADEEMKARVRAKIDAVPQPAPIVAASIEPAHASQ
jgi:tetratricopeptide (TPR) repeat protein